MRAFIESQVKLPNGRIARGWEGVEIGSGPSQVTMEDVSKFEEDGVPVRIEGKPDPAGFGPGWPIGEKTKASAALEAAGLTTVEAVLEAGEQVVTGIPDVGPAIWKKFETVAA